MTCTEWQALEIGVTTDCAENIVKRAHSKTFYFFELKHMNSLNRDYSRASSKEKIRTSEGKNDECCSFEILRKMFMKLID